MLHMEPRHYQIVIDILSKYKDYDFYAFGSRSRGNPKKFSDLDVCSLTPLPLKIVGDLQEEFYNSSLPYKVDIVDWHRCSPEFQGLIKPDLVSLKKIAN